jgi:hypothetical protein
LAASAHRRGIQAGDSKNVLVNENAHALKTKVAPAIAGSALAFNGQDNPPKVMEA